MNGLGDMADYRTLLYLALQVSIGKLKCLLTAQGSLLRLSGCAGQAGRKAQGKK
jgi:hypothetical protein